MNKHEIAFLWKQKRKSKRRSPGKNVAVKIFMGICLSILALDLVAMGAAFTPLMAELYPGQDPVNLLNGFLLYWFCVELIIRYMIQSLPVMDIVPYLHLPIQKSSLIRFLQIKGFSHPANYISFLFFIPFAISSLSQTHSVASILVWLFTLLACTWLLIICALHIKRRELIKPSSSLLFLFIVAAIGAADYFGWPAGFSLTAVSRQIFSGFMHYPVLCILPLALAMGMVQWNFRFMRQHVYVDEAIQKKQDKVEMRGSFLGKYFGLTGALMDLDIKLAWRSKRTRSQVYLIGVFLFYGLLIYPSPMYGNSMFFLCFVGVFMSAFPMAVYGQMPFDSVYFDGIFSRIGFYDYIRARYSLFLTLTVITYILTLPYAFFGLRILWINFACFLFNMGVTSIILLHMAAFNRKSVDISQASAMNMQGVTFTQVAVVLIVLVIPAIISVVTGSIWTVAILGILGLVTYQLQLKWVLVSFKKQKYEILEGFRKK